ncbi:uncharacterized protein LOC129169411 [Dunckerocampus dactyliophorus]|uniref:uncharacterized protein LOC129169411 n=1 Tax=Dunckerocampus dactyliophorus TaxID=161453 RepID=UPI002406D0B7|nr:uncharacterized protein LOC129169411 [Dunckerocampus dactyliophorus]
MAAAHALAEAEAAKARLAYAEKEMSIKMEKARLKATLNVLHLQKEADAALAKAEVIETAAAQFNVTEQNEGLVFLPPQATPEQKPPPATKPRTARSQSSVKSVTVTDIWQLFTQAQHHMCPSLSHPLKSTAGREQMRWTQMLQPLVQRKEPVAITADIEQMFYCFIVQEEHRDFLRFLWYEDNDLNKGVVDYRMRVHVFGNSPSPAVAIFGMRMVAKEAEAEYGRKHHIATLLIRHYHEAVKHQGRHFTEGAVRASGLWLVGGKRPISSIISKCVTCRKLRGKTEQQIMADLPAERLQMDPPFSYVGLDTFGPWEVVTRRTRGGQASSKRWAVLFTCMSTRAIHVEVIETLSSSSFINALRRFFAIRGPAKQLRSDCRTNFIGASKELKLIPPEPGETGIDDYLRKQRCSWVFNPPHSSHMGGSWERMIGIVRRILDSMLLQAGNPKLTHEVLTTLMAEVTAIINARPLVPVSSDPEAPLILTPSTLLTQKFDAIPAPQVEFTKSDMYKHQWKRVQVLADIFWARWQKEYLNLLQGCQKWHRNKPNMKEGDIILLKEKQLKRNDWPIGIIVKTLPSRDGVVRKIEVKVTRDNSSKIFCRPITECILLLSPMD